MDGGGKFTCGKDQSVGSDVDGALEPSIPPGPASDLRYNVVSRESSTCVGVLRSALSRDYFGDFLLTALGARRVVLSKNFFDIYLGCPSGCGFVYR